MADLLRKNKVFRVLLVYYVCSGLGGGIFQLFMLLSVHLLFENPIYTGIAAFLMMFPHFFAFVAGPVVDRSNKVKIMRRTTFIEFSAITILVVFSYLDALHVLIMFAAILIYTVAQVFESPSASAFLRKTVEEEEIMKANSLIQMSATVGGLFVAVFLLRALGDDVSLTNIYAVSAAFVVLAFVTAHFLKDQNASEDIPGPNILKPYLDDLKAGAAFVLRTNFIFCFLVAGVTAAFFIDFAYTNMPEFATTYIGAQGFVVLTLVVLVAGFFSSTLVGLVGDKFPIGLLTCLVWLAAGALRIGFANILPISYTGALAINFVYAILLGFASMIRFSLLQKSTSKEMIARVNTVHSTFIAVFGALGALAGGFAGSMVGSVSHLFVLQGVVYMFIGVVLFMIPSIRRLPKINEVSLEM